MFCNPVNLMNLYEISLHSKRALTYDQVKHFHQHINSIEPSIQWMEDEADVSIPFLDTRVIRHNDGSLSTTAFGQRPILISA